jgi:AcrR family transcriptional regulator
MNKERAVKSARAYHSPVREQQAGATRRSIAQAARALLLERGFDGTTIAAIAEAAGVSSQTVYATFGSKTGVLRAVMDLARFGPGYREQVARVMKEKDPVIRLRLAAGIARQIFEAERDEMELWRGGGAVSPDFTLIEREHEDLRFNSQAPMIDLLIEQKRLKPGMDRKTARELLWALTGRDLFRMLVVERGWPGDKFEEWLGQALVDALVAPKRSTK